MDLKMLARLGAIVLLAVALVAAAFELRRDNGAVGDAERLAGDPLTAELLRCRDLGAAATNDVSCIRIWAESRRRFLGPSAPPPASAAPNGPPASDTLLPPKGPSRMEFRQPTRGSDSDGGDPQPLNAD
jgi:conjugative transfer region protein TrbK